jgi:hypothetical protein
MLLSVVLVYQQGRKLSEAELRAAVGVVGDVRIQIVQKPDGRSVRQAICMSLTTAACSGQRHAPRPVGGEKPAPLARKCNQLIVRALGTAV